MAEQFTTVAAPVSATNELINGNLWTNRSGALSGTTGASLILPGGSTAKTTVLQCAPPNAASMSPINDLAEITQFIVTGDVFCTRTGSFKPELKISLMVNGAQPDPSQDSETTIENVWVAFGAVLDKATYFPSGIFGYQVKGGTYGPGFFDHPSAGTVAGTLKVRLVKVSIGYENPDGTSGSALLMCEA